MILLAENLTFISLMNALSAIFGQLSRPKTHENLFNDSLSVPAKHIALYWRSGP